MTTTNNPDELRAEIEQTRANLSQNVNALGEAVTPGSIARRQADKAKGAAAGVKDRVLGTAESHASTLGDRASGVGDSVGGSLGNAGQTAKEQAQGNPLAVGVIALGAGWLLGSLLPASAKERDAAVMVKEQATPALNQAQEVARDAAKEVGENLKEPAMQAADSVKSTAEDAAQTVRAEGQSVADDVKSSAQDSKGSVQEHQSKPGTSI